MTRRAIYYGLMVACVFAVTDLSAQKYPERRITRQGTALYNKGDYAGAEAEYRRALELDPELREAAFNLGSALWRQAQGAAHEGSTEQEQQAVQALAVGATEVWMGIAADSLAPAPLASAAGYNAGNVALAAQQLDAAIEAYKGALRLRPDDMEAKYNLAYAQKLKEQQDQNKDDQGGGGGGGNEEQNDQNNDQNGGDGQNDPQNGDGDGNGDGRNDPQDGDENGDGQNGNEPPPSGQDSGRPKMDSRAAEQMLDAMQAAEDDTREKVNAKEVQVGARSGKNW